MARTPSSSITSENPVSGRQHMAEAVKNLRSPCGSDAAVVFGGPERLLSANDEVQVRELDDSCDIRITDDDDAEEIGDDGHQHPLLERFTPATTGHLIDHRKDDLMDDFDDQQPVLKLRRISTPAYALKRIDRNVWPQEFPQSSISSTKPILCPTRREQDAVPNPNSMHFSFTGHHRLYPYRFYLDLIKRAKRDPSIISLEMPKLRPCGGSIIIYDCHGVDQNRALHNDGYRWGRSKGVKLIQSVGNKLVRTYHFLYDPKNPAGDPAFKKYRFSLKSESYGVMVMHYLGNEKHAADVSAKCMRNNDPMALLAYSEINQGIDGPQQLHLLPIVEADDLSAEDCQAKQRQILFENVQALQQQLLYENDETFVERIDFDDSGVRLILMFSYPLIEQLIAVAGYLQQGSPYRAVQLLYHTEPISLDYHLSTLAFIHPFFEGDQVMSFAFMISATGSSERCSEHDAFLSTLYDRFSDLLNGRFIIITGQNVCFSPESFPVAEHVRCWDDFKRVKLGYIESHFGGANLSEYASDMNILMSCTYEKLFDEMWAKISACRRYTEHPDLFSYFENVWSDFKYSGSIWHLKACGVPEADKGVTWKACKGLHKAYFRKFVLNHLCESGAYLDVMIISLFLLSNAYRRLFIAGLHQSGAWRLKKCYRDRFQQSHLKLPKLPFAPTIENIVMTAYGMCPDRQYKKFSENGEAEEHFQNCPIDVQSEIQSQPSFTTQSTSSTWDPQQCAQEDHRINFDIPASRSTFSKRCYVRLLNPMTFAVRAKDGTPHIVEAAHRDDNNGLGWYCSCGLTYRCNHISNVIQQINDWSFST